MKVPVYTMEGKRTGETKLPDDVFGVPMNADLLHQATRVLLSRRRRPFAHTKDRGDVRGGGRKPWAQKGTGRARHGSTRSPLWRGGGVTFGPRRERQYALDLPDVMRRKVLAVVLSQKFRDGEVIVLDAVRLEEPKTKVMAEAIDRVLTEAAGTGTAKRKPSLALVLVKPDSIVQRATRNLSFAQTMFASDIGILDLLSARFVLVPKEALAVFSGRVARRKKNPLAKRGPVKSRADLPKRGP